LTSLGDPRSRDLASRAGAHYDGVELMLHLASLTVCPDDSGRRPRLH
jgi:hypothetical protein